MPLLAGNVSGTWYNMGITCAIKLLHNKKYQHLLSTPVHVEIFFYSFNFQVSIMQNKSYDGFC